ncbi:uncharacterized protein LAESUDRAFT_763958 [Laetiporus sulphureus 93-53]|uniref:Uncharacterized protein n=1 Tax=Laetiporus sulphureus 93-53 TaxID=1314785 RepID=A0A165BIM3_9APHY|nr:uncharacterized protein LAESUDRAFT_763958 [Laetiporus sulphureus 93-53]KZT01129.1 hypothetical protein LAESUDRAFT_763958 [Laetiporus sulphureus 93-53]
MLPPAAPSLAADHSSTLLAGPLEPYDPDNYPATGHLGHGEIGGPPKIVTLPMASNTTLRLAMASMNPENYEFIEDRNGRAVSEARAEDIRNFAHAIWHQLRQKGKATPKWGLIDAESLTLYLDMMARHFEEMRLCDSHWKAKKLATMAYLTFYKYHVRLKAEEQNKPQPKPRLLKRRSKDSPMHLSKRRKSSRGTLDTSSYPSGRAMPTAQPQPAASSSSSAAERVAAMTPHAHIPPKFSEPTIFTSQKAAIVTDVCNTDGLNTSVSLPASFSITRTTGKMPSLQQELTNATQDAAAMLAVQTQPTACNMPSSCDMNDVLATTESTTTPITANSNASLSVIDDVYSQSISLEPIFGALPMDSTNTHETDDISATDSLPPSEVPGAHMLEIVNPLQCITSLRAREKQRAASGTELASAASSKDSALLALAQIASGSQASSAQEDVATHPTLAFEVKQKNQTKPVKLHYNKNSNSVRNLYLKDYLELHPNATDKNAFEASF